MTTRKTTALTRQTFVGKVMSLLFNMMSRLITAFLPRSKHLSISWLQSQFAVILETKKIKAVTVSIVSPSICHEVMEPDAMIFIFWILNFKPTFSLSSFTFIMRLFSYSSLSAIRVVSSAYLGLLIVLLATLIPAYASSSPALLMMYSAYQLNKQGDNIQPWHTPFPIWNQSCSMSSSNCCFLIDSSGSRSGGLLFPTLEEFSTVCCDPHKSCGIVNKAKVDAFLEFSCFFNDPVDVGHLISISSAFSNSRGDRGLGSLCLRPFLLDFLKCKLSV